MSRALEVVIAHHIASDRIILEGDGILPSMVGAFVGVQVRCVFLFESDKDFFFNEFHKNLEKTAEDWNAARAHWLYGQWLIKEAKQYQLPLVSSRPWDTLADRIQTAADL